MHRNKSDFIEIIETSKKYDATSKGYDELYSSEQIEKYKAIEHLLNSYAHSRKILDAGCGTGLLLEFLEQKRIVPAYYVGLDISTGMLRRFASKLSIKNMDYKQDIVRGDIVHTPFREKAFDTVISITVLNNISTDKTQDVIFNFKRITKYAIIISLLNVAETAQKISTIRDICGKPFTNVLKELFFKCEQDRA